MREYVSFVYVWAVAYLIKLFIDLLLVSGNILRIKFCWSWAFLSFPLGLLHFLLLSLNCLLNVFHRLFHGHA